MRFCYSLLGFNVKGSVLFVLKMVWDGVLGFLYDEVMCLRALCLFGFLGFLYDWVLC